MSLLHQVLGPFRTPYVFCPIDPDWPLWLVPHSARMSCPLCGERIYRPSDRQGPKRVLAAKL
jgi:hypothetical protein